MSDNNYYFETQRRHSKVKSELVAGYLPSWANIAWRGALKAGKDHLTYLDMFSGPGRFEDGTPSTPSLVLDAIERTPGLEKRLQLKFYEGDQTHYNTLKQVVEGHSVFPKLKFRPELNLIELDRQKAVDIGRSLDGATFSFIDPFGYKDLSLDLLEAVIRSWGCDCLFYLSVAGVERNIGDISKREQFIALLGEPGYRKLAEREKLTAEKFELNSAAVQVLKQALKTEIMDTHKPLFLRDFCVEFDNRKRPSHHLVFLSKDFRGFKIMRDMMIARSLKDEDGFPLYMFSELRNVESPQLEMDLSGASTALRDLSARLCKFFEGQTYSVPDFFQKCLEIGCPYQDSHIRKALKFLFDQNKIYIVSSNKPGHFQKNDKFQFVG